MNLEPYLIEYYVHGPQRQQVWEARFAWVHAESRAEAVKKLQSHPLVINQFEQVITISRVADITYFALPPNCSMLTID